MCFRRKSTTKSRRKEPIVTTHLLDNIVWHTLTGPHAAFSAGQGGARRYAPGFSPILGFEQPSQPDFGALRAHCAPGEHFYVEGWRGDIPDGWRLDAEQVMHQMVWDAPQPAAGALPEAVTLDAAHAQAALDLATLTRPGPFGPRTTQLGEYLGWFDGARLVAMAGERMCAGTLREISGVCTHPDFQGRGLARRLMQALLRRQMQRGEQPFLHVMGGNTHARALYARMGFRDHRETVVRVVSRL
jgi:ribosomal protein S18 acetylase RimI-like enzyme